MKFSKKDFSKWVYLAVRFKGNGRIHVDSYTRVFTKRASMTNFTRKLYWDGYLTFEQTDWWQKGSYYILPTQKFVDEFMGNFREVSKQVRPDFTDEIRERMFNSFAHLKNLEI